MAKPDPNRHAPKEIDAYLSNQPEPQKSELRQLRALIRGFAPTCTERVSYGIPIFRLGKDFVGISAAKNHCSLHTMSPVLVAAMRDELRGLDVSGATIHFTPAQPLPRQLVETILQRRKAELDAPAAGS